MSNSIRRVSSQSYRPSAGEHVRVAVLSDVAPSDSQDWAAESGIMLLAGAAAILAMFSLLVG
ncbi:MAG: hypothetical protein HC827_08665 [Cyanobacteria bacterium RM1_2_2]|nr:hypothetical protein [Cyanobacteria bacterium RM1_2_2]